MFFSVMQKQKERRKHCFVHGWAPDESKKKINNERPNVKKNNVIV